MIPPESSPKPAQSAYTQLVEEAKEEQSQIKAYISEDRKMDIVIRPLRLRVRQISLAKRVTGFIRSAVRPSTLRQSAANNLQSLYDFAKMQSAFNQQDFNEMGRCVFELVERLDDQMLDQQTPALQKSCIKASYLFSQSLLRQGYLTDAFIVMKECTDLLNDEALIKQEIRDYMGELGQTTAKSLSMFLFEPPLISDAALQRLFQVVLWGWQTLKVDFSETLDVPQELVDRIMVAGADLAEVHDFMELPRFEPAQQNAPSETEVSESREPDQQDSIVSQPVERIVPDIVIDNCSDPDSPEGSVQLSEGDDEVFLLDTVSTLDTASTLDCREDSGVQSPLSPYMTRSMGSFDDIRLRELIADEVEWDTELSLPGTASILSRTARPLTPKSQRK